MPVTLGARPEHGFDQPLGLLTDCHRRIEQFLGVLLRVAGDAQGKALSPAQRQAMETALHYFESAAPRHTADEECSLFPRMRASADPRAREALARIEALEADHVQANAAHQEVDALGRKWLDTGALTEPETEHLVALLTRLQQIYQQHIAIEDNEIFPLAGQIIEASELARIGKEMADRRGVAPPDKPAQP